MAKFKSLINKLYNLPLNNTNRTKGIDIAITIAENNGYKKEQIITICEYMRNRGSNTNINIKKQK
jgi:hypothetical protein